MTILQNAFLERNKKQNKIEQIKQLKTPLSVYKKLDEICNNGLENLEKEDGSYFLKCFGLFLKKDGTFMLRIRIPAGQLNTEQAIKIGELSKKYGEDYIDITTRQQLEFRFLELPNLSSILKELDSVGITTFQTGVDNFRNIVTSSFDGYGKSSKITCKPIIDELQNIFLKKEEWIGALPRKFNTAILGNEVNDCNIYGHDCCFVLASKGQELGFNLYLGGKVGVQATDTKIFLKVEEVVETYNAIIQLFKKYGFRDNRNKNRLHYLLESVGIEVFVDAIKGFTNLHYQESGKILCDKEYKLDKSGVFKLDEKKDAIHFSIPSGIFKGSDLIKIGELAKSVDGEIRFSVEQSLYIIINSDKTPQLLESKIFKEYNQFNNTYFNHQIACAGTETCTFGVIPNKPDAIELAHFLEKEVPIDDGKVRIYWSACPKGCGIHGVADIGLEGCKAKDENGKSCYGVHIYLGGKATKEAKEATLYAKAIPLTNAKYIIKELLKGYKQDKLAGESFEMYHTRVLNAV